MLSVIASITALVIRGFSFKTLLQKNSDIELESIEVWLVKESEYNTKMEAYKKASLNTLQGYSEFVIEEDNGNWAVINAVYLSSIEANAELQNANIPKEASSSKYIIKNRTLKIPETARDIALDIIKDIKEALNILIESRSNFLKNVEVDITPLNQIYNNLKENRTKLNQLNLDLQHQTLSYLIYSTNQSLISIADLLFNKNSDIAFLSQLNTAITRIIFSLDNF